MFQPILLEEIDDSTDRFVSDFVPDLDNRKFRRVGKSTHFLDGLGFSGGRRGTGADVLCAPAALRPPSACSRPDGPAGRFPFSGFKSAHGSPQRKTPIVGGLAFVVVGGGLEPSARGFSVRCSTN